jgi:hypothetical protein
LCTYDRSPGRLPPHPRGRQGARPPAALAPARHPAARRPGADTGEGAGKQRLWRAATSSHSWERTELAHDEDAATALGWLERDYLRLFSTDFGHWLDVAEAWPDAWQDAAGMGDSWVTVNPEQLKTLRRELDEVLERYRDADPAPDGRRVTFWTAAFPLEPDDIPDLDTESDDGSDAASTGPDPS